MSPPARPFGSLLVANRGEIAVRVLRSARAAGLRTIAVYSDADRTTPHVRCADEAVRIGPAPAPESYLSVEAILAAAKESGAEAIHPGYGFLSERAGFAAAVAAADLVFVGPSPGVIELMGRKDHAREVAERAGVPVVPRHVAAEGTPTYPLLVKAAAGGGGKGMRIVRRAAELEPALAAARREAAAAFGDDTLLLERYVEHGRHVEVQVFGDVQGSVIHLYERDCSVQRRHQKVLEEAPAPTITAAVRERLTDAAVALAREVGYVNAGTVEFLVAGDDVYFLEMNTRLQVEHPVTEAVTGLDLVALQLSVAAGEPLPFRQADVSSRGHAIEARIYAEDPYAGFLPQAGLARVVRWPHPDLARVDAALESGQRVGTAYDPMLGKITAFGPDRESARRRLVAALDDTVVVGLTTNVGFVRDLVASADFGRAAVHTAWLDSDPAGLAAREHPVGDDLAAPIAAWVLAGGGAPAERSGSPFDRTDGWRVGGLPAPTPVDIASAGSTTRWQVDPSSGAVRGGGAEHRLRLVTREGTRWRIEIDGAVSDVEVVVDPHQVTVVRRGHVETLQRPAAFGPSAAATVSSADVVAPMPGTVLTTAVAVGARVRAGDTLGVLEAMKMEVALNAPHDGTVTHVGALAGGVVNLHQVLFTIEPAP